MVSDVTGWTELISGNLFQATTDLFESFYGDWYLTLLFLAFKALLYFGSKSPLLGFIFSIIFLSVFASKIEPTIILSVAALATFELAVVLYSIIFKK